MNLSRDGADLLDGKRVAHAVSARALDFHHLRLIRDDILDVLHIDLAIDHVELVVQHAKLFQRARTRCLVADDRLHRVVRLTCERNEFIARAQDAEQDCSQCMRA